MGNSWDLAGARREPTEILQHPGGARSFFQHQELFQPLLPWREGVCAGHHLFSDPLRALPCQAWTPTNYISQAPLLTGFCQREALAGDWKAEGSKSQIIPPHFPLCPPPHCCFLWLLSAPGVWEHSSSSPSSLVGWGGGSLLLLLILHWLISPFGFSAIPTPHS